MKMSAYVLSENVRRGLPNRGKAKGLEGGLEPRSLGTTEPGAVMDRIFQDGSKHVWWFVGCRHRAEGTADHLPSTQDPQAFLSPWGTESLSS